MPWLKSSDDSDDDPLILSLCARRSQRFELVGAVHCMELYAATHKTDGFLPSAVVNEIPRRVLLKLTKRGDGAPNLIHTRGDECECMREMTWEDNPAAAFYVHGYLDDNPTRDEYDLRKAKLAERTNAEFRRAVQARDGNCCRYCGRKCGAFADNTSGRGAVLDHVDPALAIGVVNLVLACKRCNSRKGNRTPEQADMTLLPPRGDLLSDGPSETPSDPLTDSLSDTPTAGRAAANTTSRGGRDGSGRALTAGHVRPGRDNPYDRNEPNPDHHAGVAVLDRPPAARKDPP